MKKTRRKPNQISHHPQPATLPSSSSVGSNSAILPQQPGTSPRRCNPPRPPQLRPLPRRGRINRVADDARQKSFPEFRTCRSRNQNQLATCQIIHPSSPASLCRGPYLYDTQLLVSSGPLLRISRPIDLVRRPFPKIYSTAYCIDPDVLRNETKEPKDNAGFPIYFPQ